MYVLKFADRVVEVKQLSLGSVVFYPVDLNNKINGKMTPCHITGFRMSSTWNELILEIDVLGQKKEVHPGNLVYDSI